MCHCATSRLFAVSPARDGQTCACEALFALSRVSERPMAIACLRLLTLPPLPPATFSPQTACRRAQGGLRQPAWDLRHPHFGDPRASRRRTCARPTRLAQHVPVLDDPCRRAFDQIAEQRRRARDQREQPMHGDESDTGREHIAERRIARDGAAGDKPTGTSGVPPNGLTGHRV